MTRRAGSLRCTDAVDATIAQARAAPRSERARILRCTESVVAMPARPGTAP